MSQAVPVQTIFEGRIFRVERRTVPRADRSRAVEVVVHPGAAVILPLLATGEVVLIRNRRDAVGESLLELPAGTLDAGEDPRTCAVRELAEETGYRAGRMEPLVSFYSSPGFCNECLHAFLATDLRPGDANLQPGEEITLEPLPIAGALDAVRNGAIVDGKTIATLLFFDRFKRGPGGS